MARRARQRRLDLAQPAARVLHHRLLARHQIAIARFGTDVAAADGIGPALAAGLDPAGYPVVPGGVPQAWERAQVYLGLCERYQELYQAQVAELHLLMATVPLSHRRPLTDPFDGHRQAAEFPVLRCRRRVSARLLPGTARSGRSSIGHHDVA